MSRFELPKEPKFYHYESPITRAVREATETMMKQEEAECMATITREVGYSVDKSELIKALNYDREQYDKGYRDGVRETFKAELEEIKAELQTEKDKSNNTYYAMKSVGLSTAIKIIDKRIAELKGENNDTTN